MSDWKVITLGDCASFQEGYVNPSKNEPSYFGGTVKWLRATDLNNGFVYKTSQTLTEKGFLSAKKSAVLFEPDSLAISKSGTIGRIGILKDYMCGNRAVINIKVNENICNPLFIFYTLLNSKEQIETLAEGSVQKNLYVSALSKVKLLLPDINKQKEIGYILNALDQKIEINTQINQTLEQISQALFKSWFVDFDPVRAKVQALSDGLSLEQAELAAMQAISGKTPEELTALSQTQPDCYAELAETAKAFPCEMVEVDGGEVPKGWEVKRIDEVIQKIPVGKKYSSKTAFSEGLVPILDQGRSGVIGYHNDKPGVKASIEDPIIVFANHTCYMRLISYDFSAIQNVFAFKGKECNLYWLYLATLGKQEFVEYKGHFPDFLIKEIIAPPKELTELFGKYIKESFSKIFINDRENSILAKIRDLLLPKLLNGEI